MFNCVNIGDGDHTNFWDIDYFSKILLLQKDYNACKEKQKNYEDLKIFINETLMQSKLQEKNIIAFERELTIIERQTERNQISKEELNSNQINLKKKYNELQQLAKKNNEEYKKLKLLIKQDNDQIIQSQVYFDKYNINDTKLNLNEDKKINNLEIENQHFKKNVEPYIRTEEDYTELNKIFEHNENKHIRELKDYQNNLQKLKDKITNMSRENPKLNDIRNHDFQMFNDAVKANEFLNYTILKMTANFQNVTQMKNEECNIIREQLNKTKEEIKLITALNKQYIIQINELNNEKTRVINAKRDIDCFYDEIVKPLETTNEKLIMENLSLNEDIRNERKQYETVKVNLFDETRKSKMLENKITRLQSELKHNDYENEISKQKALDLERKILKRLKIALKDKEKTDEELRYFKEKVNNNTSVIHDLNKEIKQLRDKQILQEMKIKTMDEIIPKEMIYTSLNKQLNINNIQKDEVNKLKKEFKLKINDLNKKLFVTQKILKQSEVEHLNRLSFNRVNSNLQKY